MIGADQITLKLRIENARISRVDIVSNRTTMAAQIMEGKSPQEASNLIPLIFSLCGTAQLQAGLQAFEQALGFDISPAHTAARNILLHVEGISEHITRILIDWAALAEIESDSVIVRDIRSLLASFKSLVFVDGKDKIGGGDLFFDTATLHNHVDVLCQKIETAIFSGSSTDFLTLTPSALKNWINTTESTPAKCLNKWYEEKLLDGHWDAPDMLPELDQNDLIQVLDGEKSDHFITRPSYKAQTCETGPFTRQFSQDLIKAMVEEYGFGPLSRLTAKLIDLGQMLQNLKPQIDMLDQESGLFHTKALHEGLGEVEAVRGKLVHRIILDTETDVIKRYRILAPTEWNFHPEGTLKKAFLGRKISDHETIKQQAHIAVMALDPCVRCNIAIEEF